MERSFYFCKIQLKGESHYLLWFSCDEYDGFITNEDQKILVFSSISQMQSHCEYHGINVEDAQLRFYDFDAISYWLNDPLESKINCENFLTFWNLVNDARSSIEGKCMDGQESPSFRETYLKLFYGANLPSMSTNDFYRPTWTEVDIKNLVEFLQQGLSAFKNSLFSS